MSKLVRRCCRCFWKTERFRLELLCFGLVLAAGIARGQEGRKVPITFLPPPLENATYSVGIYTTPQHDTGIKRHIPAQQIRQLCEALPESAFTVGLNGLITSWDGKDDQGNPVPPGRYRVRGCAVGAVKITGHETAANDWQQMDALPVRMVEAIAFVPDDEGVAVLAGSEKGEGYELMRYAGSDGRLLWQASVRAYAALGAGPRFPSGSLEYKDGALVTATDNGGTQTFAVADGRALEPTGADRVRAGGPRRFEFPRQSGGKDGTTWKITADGVYQFSGSGEALRHLGFKPDEPVPIAVAASSKSDRLYLLESTPITPIGGWQRVRGLAWVSAGQEDGKAVSDWQTIFERDTHRPDRSLARPGSETSVTVDLVENPLTPGKNRKMEVTVEMDAKGTYLATHGGMHLRQISQQGQVTQCFLRQDLPDSMTVLQVGGPEWGMFSVEGMKNMMTFDAGEIEMTAEGEKTHSEKPAEPPDL